MGSVTLFIATSLDGYIARKDDSFDWLFMDQDYGFTPFLEGIDTVVMGRRTHDVIRAMGDEEVKGKENIVFSRTPHPDDPKYSTEDPVQAVTRLKADGKEIWLMGGGDLSAQLVNAGLLDRLVISIHPIVLGEGIPLFAGMREHRLVLKDTTTWNTGLVTLIYDYEK